MQAAGRAVAHVGEFVGQQRRQAVPGAGALLALQADAAFEQGFENAGLFLEEVFGQGGAAAGEPRQVAEHLRQRRRQGIEDFPLQVFAQQRAAGLGQLPGRGRARLGRPAEQAQADAGAPAVGLLQQRQAQFLRPVAAVAQQEGFQLGGVEAQFRRAQFQQFALQQQARQVARRAPPAGQPPGHPGRSLGQQAVEAGVQRGIGFAGVVVEHDPQRFAAVAQAAEHFDLADRPQAQGLAQAPAQGRGVEGLAAQRQPGDAGARRGGARALAQQHGLAVPQGREQQAQAVFLVQQGLAQACARQMLRWQAGQRSEGGDSVDHGRGPTDSDVRD